MDYGLNISTYENVFSSPEEIFQKLEREIVYLPDEEARIHIKNKSYRVPRQIAAFGDSDLKYTFSGLTLRSEPWSPLLLEIKNTVEVLTGLEFNFVLVNRYANGDSCIGQHKDDESDLEENSPICSLSFGETRTMVFKRPNHPDQKVELKSNSLLTMHPPTNELWTHGIPRQKKRSGVRVNLTFRRMKRSAPDFKRKHDDGTSEERYPPPKHLHSDSTNAPCELNDGLDNLFKTLDSSILEGKVKETGETIVKKELGGNSFLSCELFKEQIKVHIRDYGVSDPGALFPTKNGITMDLPTWYEFQLKLSNFNLCYTNSSFIVNNDVVVLNMKDYMQIHHLKSKTPFIRLDYFQTKTLMETTYEFNVYVIEYLFNTRLPCLIKHQRQLTNDIPFEQDEILMAKLTFCIENELGKKFKDIFKCNGCVINHPSQRQHACIMVSDLEKFEYLGSNVLLFVNMNEVVSNFVNSVDFISENFVKNISVDIRDVLFRNLY